MYREATGELGNGRGWSSTVKSEAGAESLGRQGMEEEGTCPLVSVLIPTRGDRPWLADAVDSALKQSGVVLEVIVVVNGNTPDALPDLPEDTRLRVVHEPIVGKIYAINRGALASRGRWLAFLDDDDLWEPGKLAAQLEAIAESPGARGSYTQFLFVDETGQQMNTGHAGPVGYLDVVAGKWLVLNSSLLVERELFAIVGGFSTFQPTDDVDFVIRILRVAELAFVSEPLVHYRLHSGNISGPNSYQAFWWGIRVLGFSNLQAARLGADRAAVRASIRGMVVMREHAAFMALAAARRGSTHQDRVGHYLRALALSPVAPLHQVFNRHRRRES